MKLGMGLVGILLCSFVVNAEVKPKGALVPTFCGSNSFDEPSAPASVCLHQVNGEDKAVLSLAAGRQVDFFRILDFEGKTKLKFWTLGEVKVQYNDGYLHLVENDYMETIEVKVKKSGNGYHLFSEELQVSVTLSPAVITQ